MKVGVLGLGNAGFAIHLPALRGLPAVEVVGACDMDQSRRDRAAERFGVPTFDNFATMLEQARPDVVIIGTPPASHAQCCLQSFAAGANVVCEKPFTSTIAEADQVLVAARKTGRQIALNHEFREMPIFRAVRDQIGQPGVGDLIFAQAWQAMDLPPWKEPGWRGQLLRSTLYEAGIHLVDYLMALFGEQPVSVSASTSSCGVSEAESDAVALVTLEFSRGRLAQVVQDRFCRGDTQFFEVRADATQASLRASFGGRARLSAGLLRSTAPHIRLERGRSGMAWKEVGHQRTVIERNPPDPAAVATRLLLQKTFEAFQKGSRPPATGEDGRAVLQVIAACYHSAATGRKVRLDGEEMRGLATVAMAESAPR